MERFGDERLVVERFGDERLVVEGFAYERLVVEGLDNVLLAALDEERLEPRETDLRGLARTGLIREA